MKFTINRKYFYEKLAIVSRAISPVSSMPILSGILFEVTPEKIILTASDMKISIQTTIYPNEENNLTIYESGSLVLEGKYISEIVRKMDSELVNFELVDTTLVRISNELGVFHLNGSPRSAYPDLDYYEPKNHFQLPKKELKDIVSQTSFACSNSEKTQRPVLTGINFKANEHELYCSATDTYRLARKKIQLNEPKEFNITISQKSLNDIVRSIEEDEENVDIYVDNTKAQFRFDETLYQTNLLDGKFPDIEQIIPTEFISFFQSDSLELLRAIDRTDFIRMEKVHMIRLECNTHEVRIKAKSNEIGDSNEVLATASYTGEKLTITCNGTYLNDAIKALNTDRVEIDFTGELKPFRLTNPEDDSILMIVVPLRSYD